MKPIKTDPKQQIINNRRLSSFIHHQKPLQIQLKPSSTNPSRTRSNSNLINRSSPSNLKINQIQPIQSTNRFAWIPFRFIYSIYSQLLKLFINSINWIWVPKPIRLRSIHSNQLQPTLWIHLHSTSLGLSNQSYLICIGLLILGSIELIFNSSSSLTDTHHLPNSYQLNLLRNQIKNSPFDYLNQNSLLPESNSNHNISLNSLEHRWIHPRPFSNSMARSFTNQDVTAVLLNWNRKENLLLIVAHLCRYDFIYQIIIWNNNHQLNPLKKEDFDQTECSNHKLSIINSPSNLYFFSRYLVCLQSFTKYCFFQDDDTIVTSIRTMYTQFKLNPNSIVVQSDPVYSIMYGHEWCFKDQIGKLHACFAWLGHGSFVSKEMVLQFLKTVSSLALPADQIALSDNFFTTSFNQKPLVMMTSKIFNLPTLATGFSDGHHGLQRNRIYIQKGVEELHKMVEKNSLTLEGPKLNPEASIMKSTNELDTYTFISNVESFPNLPIFWNPQDFNNLNDWENKLGKIGKSLSDEGNVNEVEDGVWSEQEDWMIRFPFSSAVDGDLKTCWRSIHPISKNEFIGIKLIDKVSIRKKKVMMNLSINQSNQLFQSVLIEGFFQKKWISLSFSKFDCVQIMKIKLDGLIGNKNTGDEEWIDSCTTLVDLDELGLIKQEGMDGEEEEEEPEEGLEGIRLVSLVHQKFGWSVWEIELRIEDESQVGHEHDEK